MSWSTEYPTKAGFYWIRNYRILGPSAAILRNEHTMAYVVPVNQDLSFWLFQDHDIYRRVDVVSAEWQGPIEPESEDK